MYPTYKVVIQPTTKWQRKYLNIYRKCDHAAAMYIVFIPICRKCVYIKEDNQGNISFQQRKTPLALLSPQFEVLPDIFYCLYHVPVRMWGKVPAWQTTVNLKIACQHSTFKPKIISCFKPTALLPDSGTYCFKCKRSKQSKTFLSATVSQM